MLEGVVKHTRGALEEVRAVNGRLSHLAPDSRDRQRREQDVSGNRKR